MHRLVIASHRLPVQLRLDAGAVGGVRLEGTVGGLATGLAAPHAEGGGTWVGWPGDLDALDAPARDRSLELLREGRFAPVSLTPALFAGYYEGYSNALLWPIMHGLVDHLPVDPPPPGPYREANAAWADRIAGTAGPGDLVWVHDYQLALVPALVRTRSPGTRIGFFLHIPFPPTDVFRVLPQREEWLRGVLGADVVGFHTPTYLAHFVDACAVLLGARVEADGEDRLVHDGGRTTRCGSFPMGIDAAHFDALGRDPKLLERARRHRRGSERLLVAIDRLDYTKGIRRRLLAFDRFLERHREWTGRVRLVQVAVPSRDGVAAYSSFSRRVNELVGRINGAHATPEVTPVHYITRPLPPAEVASLLRAADVAVITPIRDGMNLVAKEFAATRSDEDGVLVLSEFAGAAEGLDGAVVVNPYDVDATADALHAALSMPREERRDRIQRLRTGVARDHVHRWVERFVSSLQAAPGARA